MHRSAAHRDDSRNSSQVAVPLGKTTTLTSTDAFHGSEKRSRPSKGSSRAKPLASSTNSRAAIDVAAEMPRSTRSDVYSGQRASSAQGHRRMKRSPTPMPLDENDDWMDDQDAPPIPLGADKSRSRTRTSSASRLRSKTRSEERKHSSHCPQDVPRPLSRRTLASEISPVVAQDELNWADDDQDEHGLSDRQPVTSYVSQDSRITRNAYTDSLVSAGCPDARSHSKTPQLKHSLGRNKKAFEDADSQGSKCKQVSQFSPGKDLMSGLRNIVHETHTASEVLDYSQSSLVPVTRININNSYSVAETLSPSTFNRATSPSSVSVHSSKSPIPMESSPSMDRLQDYGRQRSVADISSVFSAHARGVHKGSYERDIKPSAADSKYSPKYLESPNADNIDILPSRSRSPMAGVSKPRSILKSSVRTYRPTSKQEPAENVDTDECAPAPTLRTPRARSSSRAHISPRLSANASPENAATQIPSPSLRSRSLLPATRSEISSSKSSEYKSPNLTMPVRSYMSANNRCDVASRPPSSLQANRTTNRSNCSTKLLTPESPSIGNEDVHSTSRENTPKVTYPAWKRTADCTAKSQTDTSADERLQVVDKFSSSSRPSSRAALTRLSPQPDLSCSRSPHNLSSPACKRLIALNPDPFSSDTSGNEDAPSCKASEDSHMRRQNELVDLVAGLNLDLGSQETDYSASSAYPSIRDAAYLRRGYANHDLAYDHSGAPGEVHQNLASRNLSNTNANTVSKEGYTHGDESKLSPRPQSRVSWSHEDVHESDPPSRRSSSLNRLSSTPRPADDSDSNQENGNFKPDCGNVNRDSLLMLNAERQREAFGIPPSISDVCEENELLSSAESNVSMKNPALDSEWEGEANNTLGLSLGAEKLFHSLGIGAEARQSDGTPSKGHRTSWRSSMVEAEQYITETHRPPPTSSMSASSSSSSIYEDAVPDRPWQRRERDLDRVQSTSGNSIKSSWRKMLSQSAYLSLLERHGEAEMRRQEVIWELCETEQAFLKSLRTVLKVFVHPLLGKNRAWIAGLPSNISRLLDWLDDIFQLHAQISSALQHARSSQYPVVIRIAETLRAFVPRLEVYQPYIVRLDEVVDEIEVMIKDRKSDLGEFFRIQSASEEAAGMTFSSFLWLPLTRLGRYLKHFNELWTLTPRSHVDHLPTFSLLHSSTMVVRVMREVKLREEEYTFVKDLMSRVRGLPDNVQLARRERRLVAHGALQRVHLSERCKDIIEGNITATFSQSRAGVTGRNTGLHAEPRRSRTKHHRRASSLDSCLTSEFADTGSMTSISSAASDFSLDENRGPSRKAGFKNTDAVYGRRLSKQRPGHTDISVQEKTRTTPMYAFIFTDLALFTIPKSSDPVEGKKAGHDAWELLDDIGVCRVLSVMDNSGSLGYDHMIGLHVLPMDVEQLDSGVLSDASAMSVFVHLPKSPSVGQKHSDARKRWWEAFEQCYFFTLRSLSFPAHTGRYLAYGSTTGPEQEANTRQTVMSILASGLPLPKSPSVQIEEAEKGHRNDLAIKEREERGWWALRFQQTLCEMQRGDQSIPSLQRTSLPSSVPSRKTVSGWRRLKLVSGRK